MCRKDVEFRHCSLMNNTRHDGQYLEQGTNFAHENGTKHGVLHLYSDTREIHVFVLSKKEKLYCRPRPEAMKDKAAERTTDWF